MGEKYVLNLLEDSCLGQDGILIGYWDGKSYQSDGVWFPGVLSDKHDDSVKSYTSKKRAETAVKKLQDKFTYVKDARIEVLERDSDPAST